MRIAVLSALSAAALAGASGAAAAPATIEVAIGPALQAKAVETYGLREVNGLAADLRSRVAAALARTHAYDDTRIELTLSDAMPSRPTLKQMGDKPGLSFQSFGLGGARIEGRVVRPEGKVTPLAYRWYETDIRWEQANGTWGDALAAIDQFAHRLARGEVLASR